MAAGIQGAAAAGPVAADSKAAAACGIAMRAQPEAMLESEPMFLRLSGQAGDALARGLPVGLRLEPRGNVLPARTFARFCERLAAAIDAPGVHSAALAINLPAGCLPPDTAWQVRQQALGSGPLNIVWSDTANAGGDFWLRVWRLRREPLLNVCLWPWLSGACHLLPVERADNVEPVSGLQSPTGTAWVPAVVQLSDWVDSTGCVDEMQLAVAMRALVSELDRSVDAANWPTAAMRQDAWLNRRLAIRIDGLGALVEQLGLDPCDSDAIAILRRALLAVRSALWRASASLAADTELLPAIDIANPTRGLRKGVARDSWARRWQRAVERHAVRNRNLLVVNPWCIFPPACAASRYFELLPLLRLADGCIFRDRPDLSHWNINEFRHFHQRIWSLRQRLDAAGLIAEQP